MTDFDLNLLRVFDLLYEERSVTKAATRLRLTQSAVSHALARLRDVLGDPLFVRIPSGLQATERAHQLAPRLRMALADIQSAVAASIFDPAKSSRHFTISAGSYFSGITACLFGLLRRQAPGVTLQVANTSSDLTQALDQQEVDVVLGAFDRIPARLRSEVLFHDELAWVIGAGNPLASQPLDHKTLLGLPRLGIAATLLLERVQTPPRDELVRHVIAGLEEEGEAADLSQQARRMLVHDAATAIAVAAVTDMVALLPRSYARTCVSAGQIKIIELPKGRLKPIEVVMTWHGRCDDDPGSLWLRQAIRDAHTLATEGTHEGAFVGGTGGGRMDAA
jgi:DNA-binding transcriptional LysR family regulator